MLTDNSRNNSQLCFKLQLNPPQTVRLTDSLRFIAVPSDDFDHTLVDCGTVIHCYTIVIHCYVHDCIIIVRQSNL